MPFKLVFKILTQTNDATEHNANTYNSQTLHSDRVVNNGVQ